jgi:hypothetical protein
MKTHRNRIDTRQSLPALCRIPFALLALAGVLFGLTPAAHASAMPPDTMTYQGFLVDGNGNPLAQTTPQNYPVIFRIYAVSSGAGGPLWAEQQIVTVDKGNFSVLLGEGTPVGGEPRPALSSVFAGNTASDRYISVSVTIAGNTTEILPRLRLVPSPYAFLASSAANLVQPNGTPFISYDGGQVNLTGNVGIGTLAAGRRLQVGDTSTPNSEGMIRLASRSGTGGANRSWDIGVPETDEVVSGAGYSFVIDDNLRGGTDFIIKWDTGNVGIGTVTPDSKLDVEGTVRINDNDLFLRGGTDPNHGLGFYGGGKPFAGQNIDGPVLYGFLGGALGTYQNGNARTVLHWNSAGNVGIGTATPSAPLSFGGGLANSKLMIWDGGPNNAYGFGVQPGQFRFHINQPGDRFSFLNGVAGTEVMTIQGFGNVGIGTTTPGRRFHVSGNDTVVGRFDSSHVAGTWLALGNSSAGGRYWQLISTGSGNGEGAGKLLIGSGTSDGSTGIKMTVEDNGNVGVGTPFPEDHVHVRGGALRIDDGGGEWIRLLRDGNGLVLHGNGMGNPNNAGGIGLARWDGDSNLDGLSDRRLKKDIADAEPVLGRVMQLPVRRFRWYNAADDGDKKFGVIAQEVQPLFPESVGSLTPPEGVLPPELTEEMMTVKYGSFGLIAVKALQELKAEKDAERAAFQREISELKQQLATLKARPAQAARVDELHEELAGLKQIVQRLAAESRPAGQQASAPEDAAASR